MKKWKKSAIVFGVVLLGAILVYFGTFFVPAFLFSSMIGGEASCLVGMHFQYSKSEIDQAEIINEIKNNLFPIVDPTLDFNFIDSGTIKPHRGWGGYVLLFPDISDANSTEILMIKSYFEKIEGVYEVDNPFIGCESP